MGLAELGNLVRIGQLKAEPRNTQEVKRMLALEPWLKKKPRLMAVINRRAYADLVQGTQIDIAISPAQTVIGELLAHLRRGDVAAVHSLRRGAAEALEGIAGGDDGVFGAAQRGEAEIVAVVGGDHGDVRAGRALHMHQPGIFDGVAVTVAEHDEFAGLRVGHKSESGHDGFAVGAAGTGL